MTESDLWKSLSSAKEFKSPEVHATRIENSVLSGISDVSVAYSGMERWLELKIFHGNRMHFRTSQREWIQKRTKAGGRVWVLSRDKDVLELWDPTDLLVLTPKVEVAGKSFSISPRENNLLVKPVIRLCKPFYWYGLRSAMFG